MFAEARTRIAEAIAAGVSPAATIEVGRSSGPVWRQAFGRHAYDAAASAATVDTIFDLASLTKVIATTSLVIREVSAGRLALDAPVSSALEGWSDQIHRAVTIRHLLDHSSGLPGVVRLWERASGRSEFQRAIRALPLERAPGEASVYSDPGFIALGFVLEELAGRSLDEQFRDLSAEWEPELSYLPAASLLPRIAPTEYDAARGRYHHGDVHDENAAALGGVAGHAGLFGTAPAIGAFARLVLQSFTAPTALGAPDVMRTFARATGVPGSSRALGWDTMRPTSSCGTRMSPTAIGHTGFTGTSVWIDWERDIYVVFLTNRIHPTRTNDGLIPLRGKVHDAIMNVLSPES